jgi:hypothetical protein
MHNNRYRQSGFAALELILLVILVAVIATAGWSFTVYNNSAFKPGITVSSTVKHKLPYTATSTKLDSLPQSDQATATVSGDTIKLVFKPSRAVGGIYATAGNLIISKRIKP